MWIHGWLFLGGGTLRLLHLRYDNRWNISVSSSWREIGVLWGDISIDDGCIVDDRDCSSRITCVSFIIGKRGLFTLTPCCWIKGSLGSAFTRHWCWSHILMAYKSSIVELWRAWHCSSLTCIEVGILLFVYVRVFICILQSFQFKLVYLVLLNFLEQCTTIDVLSLVIIAVPIYLIVV